MLVHPQFDPVAISIGPLSVHWYGIMYLLAFAIFLLLGRSRIRTGPNPARFTTTELDDLLFYGVLGVVVGGRLGQVLFYEPEHFLVHPLEAFAVWKGGMSFHGGFLGVLAAMLFFARKTGRTFFQVTDFIAPMVPPGLALGRIGNFINGELWGRPASPDLPWAMVFPQVDNLPRHPSQLYQAGMEGLLLFLVLWFFARRERPTTAISAVFLIGYGVFRYLAEYFRNPDAGIFGHSYVVSMGQWLSAPMVVVGVIMLLMAYRKPAGA